MLSLRDGSTRSQRRATITTPMAMVARSIVSSGPLGRRSRPSGRAREEDHPFGVARDLLERLDHPCLAAPGSGALRDGGPHALIELAAEFLDQPLLLLGHLDVPFRNEQLTVSGLHAKEPHGVARL